MKSETKVFTLFFLFFIINTGIANDAADNSDNEKQQKQYCVTSIEQDPQILLEQCLDAKDWALSNGLVTFININCAVCRKGIEKKNYAVQFLPIALYPSPFPRKLYEQAVAVQKANLLLYFRASMDYAFLKDIHREVLKSEGENITKRLVGRLDALLSEPMRQPLAMLCQRADYMASEDEHGQYVLKQVEVNAGAIGSFSSSARMSSIHRRMVANAGLEVSQSVMPLSQTDIMAAETLYHAWSQFKNTEAIILFVHGSTHGHLMLESRQVQHQLEQIAKERIQCRFITITEGLKRLKIDPVDSSLILDDKHVVGVFFDRIGVAVTKAESDLLQSFQRTTAIKTPYVLALTQSKKMQQVFTKPGVVERFFGGPGEAAMAEEIRQVQANSWGIGADEEDGGAEIIKKATEHPERYVLKSNECGPVNSLPTIYFDGDIPKKLHSMTPAERNYFYITQKLRSIVVKNHFIRPNMEPQLNVDVHPELGIFGCLVGNMNTGKVSYFSRTAHVLKTKPSSVNEGGVWSGNSVIDSPYLV